MARAMDIGDHASRFCHNKVIRFINNEVLMNRGVQDFYITFCSGSWSKVEDWLQVVVSYPQVPLALKRAYAWSSLSLSGHMSARHQEQQVLQEQVEEHETVTWTLASKLQWLREEHKEKSSPVHFIQAALQQELNEHDVFIGRCSRLRGQSRYPAGP